MSPAAPSRPSEPPGSFPRAVTVLHLRGVPIRVDWSWLIIAGLVTWVFHSFMTVSDGLRDVGTPALLAAAAVAALLFFVSLLAHELGHAFTSLDRGLPVLGITLFLLGGVTESTKEARTARDEFVIVGAGPYLSLTLAAAFGIVATLLGDLQPYATVAGYVGWANLALAVFNVVPAYPLDGGRLLRSILWAVTGRAHAATRWAARVGQVFALALAGLGVWALVSGGGGALGGLWELIIGAFLFKGAADAHRRARMRERVASLRASDVMGSVGEPLDPDTLLHEAVVPLQTRPTVLWPVGDPLRGAVGLADLERVPREDWSRTRLAEIAHSAEVAAIDVGASMDEVLDRMARAPRQMLVVTAGGRPAGLLTPSLVMEPARR